MSVPRVCVFVCGVCVCVWKKMRQCVHEFVHVCVCVYACLCACVLGEGGAMGA